MSFLNSKVVRIFGGKPAATDTVDPLLNAGDQAVSETVAAGTTVRRVFPGPTDDGPHWSYHINVTGAGGATSTLKAYYSNLPNPDPTNAAHWGAAVVTIDPTLVAANHATRTGESPEWIKFEAVAVTTGIQLWGYVRVNGVNE